MCEILVDKILADSSQLFVSGSVEPSPGSNCREVRVGVANATGTVVAATTVSVPSSHQWEVTLNLANYPELGDRRDPCSGALLDLRVTCVDNDACRWTKRPDPLKPRCCPSVEVLSAEGQAECEVLDDRLQRPLLIVWRVVRSDTGAGLSLGCLGEITATVTVHDAATSAVVATLTRTYSGQDDDYRDSKTFVLPAGQYSYSVELDDRASCTKASVDGTVTLDPCSCAEQPSIKGKLTIRRPADVAGQADVDVTDAVYNGDCINAERVTVELPEALLNAGLPSHWEAPAVTDPVDATRAVRATVALRAADAGATVPAETPVKVTVGFPPCDGPLTVVVKRCPPPIDPPKETSTGTTTDTPPDNRPKWLGDLCSGVDCRWTLGAWKFISVLFLISLYLGVNFLFDYQPRATFNQELSKYVASGSQAASKAATAAAQALGASGAVAYGVGAAVTEALGQVASAASEAAGTLGVSVGTYLAIISAIQQALAYFGMFMLICAFVFFLFAGFFLFIWLSCCWRGDLCTLLSNIAWVTSWAVAGVSVAAFIVVLVHIGFEADPASRVLAKPLGIILIAFFSLFASVLTLASLGLKAVLEFMGCKPLRLTSWPSEGGY